MPSKSPAQARLMAAAAHTAGGYGGVPQKVGKEFNEADKVRGPIKPKAPVKNERLSQEDSARDRAKGKQKTLMKGIGVSKSDLDGHEHLLQSRQFSGTPAARNPVQRQKARPDGLAQTTGNLGKGLIGG